MAYGERIRFYRVLRNMSQEELSAQAGITYTSISRIEHGTRKVTLEEAVRFAEIFGISLHDLAGIAECAGENEAVKTLVQQCAQKVREAATLADHLERTFKTHTDARMSLTNASPPDDVTGRSVARPGR